MSVRTLGRLLSLVILLAFWTTATTGQDKKAVEPKKPVVPYTTAHAAPLEPKEEAKDDDDNYKRLRVEFNGIKKDRVPAYLWLPKRHQQTFPAVLLQYGIGGNKNTDYIVAIGKQFTERGFVVLTIDAPGVGERRPKEGKKQNAIIDMILGGDTVPQYCGDYSRAVDYLLTRKDVDKDRVGFVGISWGAITGVTYVAHDDRIKAMGCMVGGGNFLNLYDAKTAEKVKTEGSKSTDPVYHVARIAPRPLLFVNVTKDQLVMKPWAESLHKYAGPGAKVVWHETDHYFKGVDRAKICESVIDFMEAGLKVKSAK